MSTEKITILLQPTGGAPILKQKKFNLARTQTVLWLTNKLRSFLNASKEESVFLYVSRSFCPTPNQTMAELYDLFKTDDKLVFHYSKQPSFG